MPVVVREPWRAAVDESALNLMEELLREQMTRGASDLHLRSGEPPLMRVNGDIVRLDERPVLDAERLGAMLYAIMPDRNRQEFHEVNDSDFAYEIPGLARFRVNALLDRHGPAAVCRAIPSEIITAEQLGLSAEVQALCKLTKGLVLVTGPTGSGKSTTLCALVDLVNRQRQDHIVTIEDPIEFVHASKGCLVTQRQVGVHTSSFKHALRAALREDPDVVLVGELRDLETVGIAIETAETGHLVFGTLHTTTAASTIDRIIDQFPADRQEQIRTMLAESLKGVIAQTLCRKIGGGRVAAMEVLLTTAAVSNLIRESKTFQIPSVMQTSRRLGMITLNDALVDLVEKEKIEPQGGVPARDRQGDAGQHAQGARLRHVVRRTRCGAGDRRRVPSQAPGWGTRLPRHAPDTACGGEQMQAARGKPSRRFYLSESVECDGSVTSRRAVDSTLAWCRWSPPNRIGHCWLSLPEASRTPRVRCSHSRPGLRHPAYSRGRSRDRWGIDPSRAPAAGAWQTSAGKGDIHMVTRAASIGKSLVRILPP